MRRGTAGFTLIEILVTLLVVSVTMAGVGTVVALYHHASLQQGVRVGIEDNVRLGLETLTDTLRNGRYGVPAGNLTSWITWVPGFTSNPIVTGTVPNNIISVASASAQPVALLAARAAIGATTLSLTDVTAVNTGSKALLLIYGAENVLVTAVFLGNPSSVNIDTDPTVSGNQGLKRSYPQNTPVYRVDVTTFKLQTNGGISQLVRDDNQGAGSVAIVDDITGLAITTVAAQQYKVALTGLSSALDPLTGTHLQTILTSNVALAN